MTNTIEEYEPIKAELVMSDVFAESGMFPDIKSKAQALVKVLAGKELGISPFESMASIYIVNGKLALTSKCMSALIKKSPNYDYKVEKLDNEECTISFFECIGDKEKKLGESNFTFKDAAAAGLANKEVWRNYKKNMLFARCISNGARWYCPEVLSGYYTTEELNDIPVEPVKTTIEIDSEGEVLNGGQEEDSAKE